MDQREGVTTMFIATMTSHRKRILLLTLLLFAAMC
jgi:hypothetical protein